jgi:hypothetical protein
MSSTSAEAEYRTVTHVIAESSWIRQLLQELRQHADKSTIVYCDNVSVVYLSTNPVQHHRAKHIEVDISFVRDKLQVGEVQVLHALSSLFVDIFTKRVQVQFYRSSAYC